MYVNIFNPSPDAFYGVSGRRGRDASQLAVDEFTVGAVSTAMKDKGWRIQEGIYVVTAAGEVNSDVLVFEARGEFSMEAL